MYAVERLIQDPKIKKNYELMQSGGRIARENSTTCFPMWPVTQPEVT